jgi:hypothetical protein
VSLGEGARIRSASTPGIEGRAREQLEQDGPGKQSAGKWDSVAVRARSGRAPRPVPPCLLWWDGHLDAVDGFPAPRGNERFAGRSRRLLSSLESVQPAAEELEHLVEDRQGLFVGDRLAGLWPEAVAYRDQGGGRGCGQHSLLD